MSTHNIYFHEEIKPKFVVVFFYMYMYFCSKIILFN